MKDSPGRSPRLIRVAAVLAFGLLLALAPGALAAKDDLALLSRVGRVGPGGDGVSYVPLISADGRYVAFRSTAANLSDEDAVAFSFDAFVRDTLLGATALASRASGVAGPAAVDNSFPTSISADGRYVAFHSGATNLSAEDNDTFVDVFVRDTLENSTLYASRASGAAGAAGNGGSDEAALSADGRYVAFTSSADSLSSEDNNVANNVFVRDVQQSTTTYVSRASGASGAPGDSDSADPAISADGRYVAFTSSADSLSTEDDNAGFNIFVRDVQQSTTTYVSRAARPGDGSSQSPSISADGRYVAFDSVADSLSGEDDNSVANVFVRDMQQGTTTYVSRASGVGGSPGDGDSLGASISADGRYVAFTSSADSLSSEDNNSVNNVFVRDMQQATTAFDSRAAGAAGAAGNDASYVPSLSADGRYVAFTSDADNFSGEDNDVFTNVFVRDLLGAPPVNSAVPQVTGSAVTGGQLACSDGSWQSNPASFARQWKRGGADIAGATGSTYTVTGDDVGQALTCTVVATNTGGSGSATSNAVFPPAPGAAGATGPTGPPGATGPTGSTGPAGAKGDPAFKLVLIVSSAKLKARSGRRLVVPYVATTNASVTLDIVKGRKRVAHLLGSARAGRNTIAWKIPKAAKVKPGGYSAVLAAKSTDGQIANDTVPLTIKK
jgi:Tol biopolymer transport system component